MGSVKAFGLLLGLRALPGEEFRPALLESFVRVQSQHQRSHSNSVLFNAQMEVRSLITALSQLQRLNALRL